MIGQPDPRWPALEPGAIHLWTTTIDRALTDAQRATLLTRFTDDELRRHRRLHRLADRDAFLLAHAMLYEVLAGYDGIPPLSRLMLKAEHGKPFIADLCNPSGLQFNLSHSGRYAVLVVSRGAIDLGVDIEVHRPERALEALARRSFSAHEFKQFSAAGGAATSRGVEIFFALWSLKEAFVKAHGRGIALGLERFWFTLDANEACPDFDARPEVEVNPGRWHFRRLFGLHGYSVALANTGSALLPALFGFDPIARSVRTIDSLADATDYQH